MTAEVKTKYDVGGVLLDRPFKIRRLGHFGFNVDNIEACRHFYVDLLGFRISDEAGMGARLDEQTRAKIGDTRGFFTRHNTDHHTFVLFNRKVMSALAAGRPRRREDITINQITWQVGSLAEVGAAGPWLQGKGVELQRVGRDMPGSNWHTYVYDPDGHTNELYYGIEQVGWEGYSKPRSMYHRGFREAPSLPQINEFQEVQDALASGVDLHEGYRHVDDLPATYDVEGVLLPRPFKVTKIGPVGLFVDDLEASERFYRDGLGFIVTEETNWRGHRGVFLRTNTEHHSVALLPTAARAELGLSPHTTNLYFGLQLGSYRQLRNAVDFLRDHGVRVETDTPSELHPGIDYAAHAFDADGHCIELYYYMEQVGWDGKPRPREERLQPSGAWPEAVEAQPDTYHGEPFLGPWG